MAAPARAAIALVSHKAEPAAKGPPARAAPTHTGEAHTVTQYALVVEPDGHARSVLVARLARDNLEVTAVPSAEEALATLRRGQAPAVVVSEVELPGEDGFGLCELVRWEERTNDVPVLLVAKNAKPGDRDRALAAGANHFLPKPAFVDDIAALVLLQYRRVGPQAFLGRSAELPIVSAVRALLAASASGRLVVLAGGKLSFREGKIVGCHYDRGEGVGAVDRLFALAEGEYEVHLGPVLERGELAVSLEELVGQVVPRLRRWTRLTQVGVPLDARLTVDFQALSRELGTLPHDIPRLVRLLDGDRTVRQVVIEAPFTETAALEALTRLYALGVVQPHPLAPVVPLRPVS